MLTGLMTAPTDFSWTTNSEQIRPSSRLPSMVRNYYFFVLYPRTWIWILDLKPRLALFLEILRLGPANQTSIYLNFFFTFGLRKYTVVCSTPKKFLMAVFTCHWSVKHKFGERSFSHAWPKAWNDLPFALQELTDTFTFKRQLKTHLFTLAYTNCLT